MSDHELKIGDEIVKLNLVQTSEGTLYSVIPEIPPYRNPLVFSQSNWIGGHGQYDFINPTKYFEGQSIDTTQDGRIILGPLINQVGVSGGSLGANPVCFCWFSAIGKLMAATATKVFWYDGTNFVEKEELAGKTITGMHEFNGVLFVSLAGTDEYYYSTDAVTFTESTLTIDVIHGFKGAPNPAGTANNVWGWVLPNKLYMNTSGINGGAEWDIGTLVGDTSNDITNVFLHGNRIMIGKEDNLYHYDSSGGIHPQMDNLLSNRSTNNFKYVIDWQSNTIFSEERGTGKLSAYDAYTPCDPLWEMQDIGKVGDTVGIAADKEWIYIAKDEGTNTHIYKGRVYKGPNGTVMEWCPWVYLGANTCATAMKVNHSATDRRLWFGYGNYAAYVILSDNPTADSSARFASSGWVRMSYEYGTNKEWDKLFQSVITETKACASNLTATIKYRKDTDTTATTISGAITKNGIRRSYFSNPIDCKRVQFEIHLATNSSSTTPEVLHFEALGVEKPQIARIHDCTYSIGDKPSGRTKSLRDKLRDAAETTSLIKFTDLRYKDERWVVVEPGYPQEMELAHEKNKQPEMGLRVRFREVNFT